MVAAVVTPLIIGWLSGSRKEARQQGQERVAEYSWPFYLLMTLGAIFFFAIAVLAHHFPGKSGPQGVLLPIAVFLFFGVFHLVTIYLMRKATVRWNHEEIWGPNWLGKPQRALWREIQACQPVEWAQCVKLLRSQGDPIWVSLQMSGVADLMLEVEQRVGPPAAEKY
jgi:hypothetical protein